MSPAPPCGPDPVVPLVLQEWQDRTFAGIRLTREGRERAERLSGAEASIDVSELRDGLRVRTRSWVGVVRLGDVEIRVVPKLAGNRVDLVRLLDLTLGLDGLTRLCGEAGLEAAGDRLVDLVALLLGESCLSLLRRGLLAGYVEREEPLPVVRGRILGDRQVLRRFGRLDRVECRFDELEHDIDENRLLAIALRVAHRRVRSVPVRRRLARLRAVLEPICDETQLDLRSARKAMTGSFYHRLNSHYRECHGLAWLLLDGLGVDDLLASGSTRSFAFLLDMNVLFERFVEHLVTRALIGTRFRVRYQAAQRSILWNATAHRPYGRIVPDLLVESGDGALTRLAIDAKYKLYDERHIDPGDIYQTFLYAYAISARSDHGPPSALILYPSSAHGASPLRLRVRPDSDRESAEIMSLGVSIPAALDAFEKPGTALLENLSGAIHSLLGLSAALPEATRLPLARRIR